MKRSRTPVLRVERSMGVAVFRCVREMTLRREVDRIFDKLTHPGDETPQEENGESRHNDALHGRVILRGTGDPVNRWTERRLGAYTSPVRMRRSLLFLCLLLLLPLGLPESREDRCARKCAQEESDQKCPPDCQLYGCCSTSRAIVVADEFVPLGLVRGGPLTRREPSIPLSPEPREIFHVPKSDFA